MNCSNGPLDCPPELEPVGTVKCIEGDEWIGHLGGDEWLYLGYTREKNSPGAEAKARAVLDRYLRAKKGVPGP